MARPSPGSSFLPGNGVFPSNDRSHRNGDTQNLELHAEFPEPQVMSMRKIVASQANHIRSLIDLLKEASKDKDELRNRINELEVENKFLKDQLKLSGYSEPTKA